MAAASLNMCKADGSDGNVSSLGISEIGSTNGNTTYLNADACSAPKATITEADKEILRRYAAGGTISSYDRSQAVKRLSSLTGTLGSKPLLNIGGAGDENLGIGIDTSNLSAGGVGDIVKVNLKRVGAFPDFIMNWVQ